MLDANPPRPLSQTMRTLVSELGERASAIESFDPTPLSTASIAQVHAARLSSGAKVVVKLQHAEVARVMRQDMVQSLVLGRLLAFFEPEFDFTSLLAEANSEHEKELDFTTEASNLVEVRANLHRSRVVAEVPTPIPTLVTEKVLVMTFSEGIPLKSRAHLLDAGVDLQLLVARVCEAWAQQMFTDGVFNADPHPGNLLVRNEPGLGPLPVLLDFGLCKRLSSTASLGFCKLVHALSEQDGDGLMDALIGLGLNLHVDYEPFEFLAGIAFAFRNSDADATAARKRHKDNLDKEHARDTVYKKDTKSRRKAARKQEQRAEKDGGVQSEAAHEETQKPRSGDTSVMAAIPPEVVYFFRTIDMLQGLCTRLEVSYPFLRPMASAAQQRLLKHSRQQLLDNDASTAPPTLPPTPQSHPTPPSRLLASPPLSQRGVTSPPSSSQRLLSPLLSAVGRPSVLRPLASAGPQQRTQQLLSALASTGELLGAQACLIVRGKMIVDASAGRMGTVDARPVQPDTLFQLFQAGAPLLSAMVLQAVARGDFSLDDPVRKAWPAFGAPSLSVGGLLAHRSGLAACIPSGTRLKHLLQPLPMAAWLAAAAAETAGRAQRAAASDLVAGERGGAEFEGAPWGWTVAGLLHASSLSSGGGLGGGGGGGSGGEWSLQVLLEQCVTAPLGIAGELRVSLTPEMSRQLAARFTTSQMMRELGLEISDMMGAAASEPPPATAVQEAAGDAGTPKAKALRAAGSDDEPDVYEQSAGDGTQWERFQGAQQLQNPATLNASQLRTACVPGVSAHGSARALARFYAALVAGSAESTGGAEPATATGLRLPHSLVAHVAQPASSGTLNSAPATWGLGGLQLGHVVDTAGRTLPLVGHLGLGGVIGLAVPGADVALAVTVSQLSVRCAPTRRLVELLLHQCGLRLKPGFFSE